MPTTYFEVSNWNYIPPIFFWEGEDRGMPPVFSKSNECFMFWCKICT